MKRYEVTVDARGNPRGSGFRTMSKESPTGNYVLYKDAKDAFNDGYRQALQDVFAVGNTSFANSLDKTSGQWTTAGQTSAEAFNSIQMLVNNELGIDNIEWYKRGKKISPLLGQFVTNLEKRNLNED